MRFSAHTDTIQTHIDSVQAFITSKTQGVPNPNQSQIIVQCPSSCQSSSSSRTSETDAVPWDTNALTPYNGSYTFHVKARFLGNNGYPHDATKTADDQCVLGCNLVVDNPPQQPNAPKIVVATDKNVSLAWDANPEPDMTRYTIYRAVTKDKTTMPTDAQFKVDFTIEKSDHPSARDPVTGPGTYWYRVRATRSSYRAETRDTGISSQLSDRSGPGVVSTSKATAKPGTKKGGGKVVALPPPAAAILTPPGLIPSVAAAPPPVPDAPYSAYLPYSKSNGAKEDAGPPAPEAGASTADPRGAILPVAVGAFLVSSALALGRMPFGAT
jgi:hypothetical protein